MQEIAQVGDYVQVEQVVLQAGERAPGVPDDTASVPLVMRVKGFALSEAAIGDEIKIETVIGRTVSGKLVNTDPRYDHDFGRPVPEIVEAGLEARTLLREPGTRRRGDDL